MDIPEAPDNAHTDKSINFSDLGVSKELCDACARLGYEHPTEIQQKAIPPALEGNDLIGLAQTGSGKTAAFAIPILDNLIKSPQPYYACVLAPTRELVFQIAEQFEAIGASIGVRVAVIIGGVDIMAQAIALSKKPHIIVATPGRLQDHLENTKGFSLRTIKYLVMDEADRLLDMDFGPKIELILSVIPDDRRTFLFSATMTDKVAKLQRASIRGNPVKVHIATKYSTVHSLLQYYAFFPLKHKDTYLTYLLNELSGHTTIIFSTTIAATIRVTYLLRNLGFPAIAIHGKLTQSKRLGALNKFKSGQQTILVATDVVARGLDIPCVDLVVNYDLPTNPKSYIHRVGRTARAGRAGKAVSLVTQYDIEMYQKIETAIKLKLDVFPLLTDKSAILLMSERVDEAARMAAKQIREEERLEKEKSSGSRGNNSKRPAHFMDSNDGEEAANRIQSTKDKYRKRNNK